MTREEFLRRLNELLSDVTDEERAEAIGRLEETAKALKEMGLEVLPSQANFLFARHPEYDAGWLFQELKKWGIYVRHWNDERIRQYLRITIGTDEEMDIFFQALRDILNNK